MATKIVLAEDEAIIRLDLRESLIEEGYEVVGDVGRGDKAIEIVRETRPDVAIFDIKMPGMSGLEAAKIVSDEKLCAVVMLTAFSQREIIEQARDAGALAYIVKPFQKSDLVPAIELAIARFAEMRALTSEVAALGAQLEIRKLIDRAKGVLIDKFKMSEAESFSFIQSKAMSERKKMGEIADQIISGTLHP
ncbi:MAG: response regulator, partial [Actinobacteria bacterium]|nr:response regulator [Actinomycetota bacterium]